MTQTPNRQLAFLIEVSGLTYASVAAAVRVVAAENGETLRTNKSTIEHWIRGTRPAGRTGRYLAEALSRRLGYHLTEQELGLPPSPDGRSDDSIGLSWDIDPIETLLLIWRAELDRRRFLTSSAYSAAAALLPLGRVSEIAGRTVAARSGQTVGMSDVHAVRDMVRAFSEMDERHGGQHGRTALITYLQYDVAPLCRARFATEQVRRQMLSAASRAVHLAGFKAYDAGQQGLAQRYYMQSFALAVESGVAGNDGFILRTMAMQGLKRNRPEECQALADAGLMRAKGRVDSHTEAMFRIVHAHTLAMAGQPAAAMAEVSRAHALVAAPPLGDTPFWALAWGPRKGPFTRVPPRYSPPLATTEMRPSSTRAPQLHGRWGHTPVSMLSTRRHKHGCNYGRAESSWHARRGAEPWITWPPSTPSGPDRRSPRCAVAWHHFVPVVSATQPISTSVLSPSSGEEDDNP